MSRKQRKWDRKRKGISQTKEFEGITNTELKMLAKKLTEMPRDRSKDGKTFYDGKFGCYEFGEKRYCKDCFYNKRNCHKKWCNEQRGKPDLIEKEVS